MPDAPNDSGPSSLDELMTAQQLADLLLVRKSTVEVRPAWTAAFAQARPPPGLHPLRVIHAVDELRRNGH